MRKNVFLIAALIIALFLNVCINSIPTFNIKTTKKTLITSIPTLFFQGGSSYHAEKHMVEAAKKAVDNISSLSLKYLVANRAKYHRVVEIKGRNAQHSRLHNNSQVDKILIKFLWDK